MVPEAPLEETEAGVVAKGDGWFVLNAKDSRWYHSDARGAFCDLEGDAEFTQLGINLQVLGPGQPMAMYHWEADQEDFLVVSGEALLIIESQERTLRAWDFVHCPPNTKHTIIGAGEGPCVVVAVGARDKSVDNPDWGGYTVDDVAQKHGVGVDEDTNEAVKAYARYERRDPTRYRAEWLG